MISDDECSWVKTTQFHHVIQCATTTATAGLVCHRCSVILGQLGEGALEVGRAVRVRPVAVKEDRE